MASNKNNKIKKELIAMVEEYPCLYDKQNKDYHDKDDRDASWSEIAKVLKIEGTYGVLT